VAAEASATEAAPADLVESRVDAGDERQRPDDEQQDDDEETDHGYSVPDRIHQRQSRFRTA
jgi:hypothetical protein